MKISTQPPIDLTYCLNVHPGETWEQQFEAICENTLAIRDAVTADRPSRRFGLGLRLSALSAQQLLGEKGTGTICAEHPLGRKRQMEPVPFSSPPLETFKTFLDEQDLYVFTVNGFPYGQFHHTIVKDHVYKPDWTQPARRKYTETIARVLTELIAEGETASISTAPLTFKGWPNHQQSITPGLEQLVETAYTLWQLYQQTGRRIVIALEPEPYCYPETTPELLEVFDTLRHDLGPRVLQKHGVSPSGAAEILQQHLGVCFDTAHQAVEFEDLTESLQTLLDAEIPIAKVQLSAALEVDLSIVSPEALARFADSTYLHQTYVQSSDGTIERFVDLEKKGTGSFCHKRCLSPFSDLEGKGDRHHLPFRQMVPVPFSLSRARIHYHWPLYQPKVQEGITSTANLLPGSFAKLLCAGQCPQWEIETYTWNILPPTPDHPPIDLRAGIAQEFQWVLENLIRLDSL